jgi:hypothetical protein
MLCQLIVMDGCSLIIAFAANPRAFDPMGELTPKLLW